MNERLYKIGDVAQKLKLKSYVLRYWETEFPQLRPTRTPKGQRLYSDKTIKTLLKIQYLLHEQGLTIDGARKVLSGSSELKVTTNSTQNNLNAEPPLKIQGIEKNNTNTVLMSIQKELFSIKTLLQKHSKQKT